MNVSELKPKLNMYKLKYFLYKAITKICMAIIKANYHSETIISKVITTIISKRLNF